MSGEKNSELPDVLFVHLMLPVAWLLPCSNTVNTTHTCNDDLASSEVIGTSISDSSTIGIVHYNTVVLLFTDSVHVH